MKQTYKNQTPIIELCDKRAELNSIMTDAKQALDDINDQLFDFMRTKQSVEVGGYKITKASRLSFKGVPLEIAKKYRAVKKVVDASVLKPLYVKGVNIPNVMSSDYIIVTHI